MLLRFCTPFATLLILINFLLHRRKLQGPSEPERLLSPKTVGDVQKLNELLQKNLQQYRDRRGKIKLERQIDIAEAYQTRKKSKEEKGLMLTAAE